MAIAIKFFGAVSKNYEKPNGFEPATFDAKRVKHSQMGRPRHLDP